MLTRSSSIVEKPSSFCGDVGPLSSLHVSDWHRRGWWWPCLAVKTTAGDGMLMLQNLLSRFSHLEKNVFIQNTEI